jgi:GH25 family lysozyme M1 (1,4-beta-N-acetylmuramidase)
MRGGSSPSFPGALLSVRALARRRPFAAACLLAVAGLLVLAGATPAGALLSGVDVASHQHPNGAPIDWAAVRASGQEFAFIKATEGRAYTNPYFASDWRAAGANGLYRGAYHFARPALPLATAVDQARYFVSRTGTMNGAADLPGVLDLETTGGLGRTDLANWARAWLAEVERLTGKAPMIYTGYYFWRDSLGDPGDIGARYRLWLPSYPLDPNSTTFRPSVPAGWETWTFWQYRSDGTVPGISGGVDVNRFCCDPGSLSALGGGAVGAGNPFGNLEGITRAPGRVEVQGWAIDPDTTAPIDVDLHVDGRWVARARADAPRLDVGTAYPGFGVGHGLAASIPVSEGARQLCAYAVNRSSGSTNPLLGCRSLVANPVGNLESVTVAADGSVRARGWALDADAPDPIPVHLYVDGQWGTGTTTPVARPDVQAAYPGAGPNQGFTAALPPLSPGRHTVCGWGLNIGSGTANADLGCRAVDVPVIDPVGALDRADNVPGGFRLRGWALDFDSSGPIDVHFYVDGAWGGAVTAGAPSPEITTFFRLDGGRSYDVTLPVSAGRHTVCAYGINVGRGSTNPLLGCRTLDRTSNPIGRLDSVVRSGRSVTIAGWALDPDTADPIGVHVYVDGAWGGLTTASVERPDVGAFFPDYGSAHGFSLEVGVPPGPHQVCAYLINAGAGGPNPLLGCRGV